MPNTTINTKYGTAKLNRKGYYYITSGEHQGKYLHRLIWEDYHKKSSEGRVIHHKDGNKRNNNPRNLQILNRSEHSALHNSTPYKKRGNRNINTLLKQYSKSYVPGEKRSTEYDKMIRREHNVIENLMLFDEIRRELPDKLTLNKSEMDMVEHLVKVFSNNFKWLHRQCKKETVILAFIFFVKKTENASLQIEDYSYLKKNGLTLNIYTLIISRACMYYMEKSGLILRETTDYDHELLIKHNGVWYPIRNEG